MDRKKEEGSVLPAAVRFFVLKTIYIMASFSAKRFLDFISIFLFCTLLFSLGMLWYSVNELEEAEREIRQAKIEKAIDVEKRLNSMIKKMESRDDGR